MFQVVRHSLKLDYITFLHVMIPFGHTLFKFLDCGNEKSEITLLIFLWEICFIIIIMGFVELYCSTSRISRASDSSLVKAAFVWLECSGQNGAWIC